MSHITSRLANHKEKSGLQTLPPTSYSSILCCTYLILSLESDTNIFRRIDIFMCKKWRKRDLDKRLDIP